MKLRSLLMMAAGVLTLAGCSSTSEPAKVESGPIRATTFSFVNHGARSAPAYSDQREAIHSTIQAAITKNLGARGVAKTASGGDVTVGYLLIVGNNASVTSLNDYFGYGSDVDALQQKAHSAYTASKNPNYFEAGTLVIDVIDSRSYKLLKRGYATRPLLQNPTEADRSAHIQGAVDEILRDVRIAQ